MIVKRINNIIHRIIYKPKGELNNIIHRIIYKPKGELWIRELELETSHSVHANMTCVDFGCTHPIDRPI